jgi:protein-S-isoprenylcysteine O-methyltransferase Ste14
MLPKVAQRIVPGMVSSDAALDLAERAIVVGLFGLFVYRMLGRFAALVALQIEHPELIVAAAAINLGAILLVLSESLGVFLILLRRRSPTLSAHPLDWVLSFVAVNAPLLTTPAAPSPFLPPEAVSALMFAGLTIQISAKVSLWRSFGVVPANRGIKTGGLYRFIRHPIYAGYAVTHIGFLVGFPSVWNTLLYVAAFLVQLARIAREERLLMRDPVYRRYAEGVRYRLIPPVF